MKASSQQYEPASGAAAPLSEAPVTSGAPVNRELLHWLADAHGVGTTYQGWDGLPHEVAPDTLIRVLAALGVQAETDELIEKALADAELAPWRRVLPPAVVMQEGEPAEVPVHVRAGTAVRVTVVTEDGRRLDAVQQEHLTEPRDVDGITVARSTFQLPDNTGLGWHTLRAESEGQVSEATLVVVPSRLTTAAQLEERRGWGLATQLYSVRSERSWGVGDFADLADLTALAGSRGADYVLVNPLHAADPVPPVEPSPYSP